MKNIILDNIRVEVRNYLLYGKVMPKRDPRWDSDIARILEEERINVEAELIDTIYYNQYKLSKTNMSFDQWLEISKSLYKITADYTVISIAKGPDSAKEWLCKSLAECHKKIVKLISIKRYDHFVRGHDFMYKPARQEEEVA